VKLLTLARDLKRRRAREREQLFVVEGVRAVEELLSSQLRIKGILVAPQLDAAPRGAALHESIRQQSTSRDFGLAEVDEKEFHSAAETESPQGVLAIVQTPERSFSGLDSDGPIRLLILDSVQDPGNVGTILRTASALGVTATIALPGTVDLWNAKVVRSAMGAHFTHYAFHASLDSVQHFLMTQNVTLWATDTAGVPIDTVISPSRLAIAVGNEGAGISVELSQSATQTVALPIAHVESLNVAVATAIFLYVLRP
jgi:RNA methyltransferase, TrmH family